MLKKSLWLAIALTGAIAIAGIALHRGESINAIWFIAASVCVYLVAYRFYSAWVCTKVLVLDTTRATPAERLNNGRDFIPTHKWVTFGHHFAAIAGPGPLIGPTLAMQFGYLPGTLWILVGAVLGGCVQDMIILFCSTRRDGRSLGQMARDELGPIGGWATLLATMMIILILIAVLALVVVRAMQHSPWATATVLATIPVAMFVGGLLKTTRHVLFSSLIGLVLLVLCVVAGGFVNDHALIRQWFDWDATTCAWFVMIYGFGAATLPVWLLLAPRDYLSTMLKLGVVVALAIAIVILAPDVKMPYLTEFARTGLGPIFKGNLMPFVFITIACGAVSGFHSLVASGTTPKLISNEQDIRLVGYGSMMLESFVAIMAVLAATILEPGVYFAINSPAGVVGEMPAAAVATISSWGFAVSTETMQQLARDVGEQTLFARTGGAPSLAVGMATIFANTFGKGLLAIWYHFAIMFEVMFILTTLDAGTRVGRFILQDLGKVVWPAFGRVSSYPMTFFASFIFVAGWGYFLWQGIHDPLGGVNILWPLFGIANQLLAGIALTVATAILIKMGKLRFIFITAVPLAWLAFICTFAAIEKIFNPNPDIGFLAGAQHLMQQLASMDAITQANSSLPHLIFAERLDALLAGLFVILFWIIMFDMLRVAIRFYCGKPVSALSEAVYVPSQLVRPAFLPHHATGGEDWQQPRRCC